MKHEGKVVVVTGAAHGIGRRIALAYGAEGARVVLADIDGEAGTATAAAIQDAGGEALFVRTDVANPREIQALMKEAVEAFGAIHILVNNAGVSVWKSPYELAVEEWDRILDTNLRGGFLCSREAAKTMRENGGGSIVNIASTRALMSEPHGEAYGASKGGLQALTHALAASLGPDGIRVNCISPGWIETGVYGMLKERDHAQHFSGRVGKPEDVARACLYLTEEGNDFINGANLVLDGGMTRKMVYEE
ncbi:glucose 1-dehydrogenase [Anaerotalea alkaliphila]|uniref:Glucose 1-dehydrogenase n=1 Tax=Anaerotalea alkaliphila TaxID=2662126 RepID=A0A7X5HVM0_9FIRM|nr:glucose 1-dehydrogenase [Anaerotalea alkaliphila]NDL67490.1 glucose 1-dehydrogenase [Anaerotalea alkaliphila]